MNKKNILIIVGITFVSTLLIMLSIYFLFFYKTKDVKVKATEKKVPVIEITDAGQKEKILNSIQNKFGNYIYEFRVSKVTDFNKVDNFDKFCIASQHVKPSEGFAKDESGEEVGYDAYNYDALNLALKSRFGENVTLTKEVKRSDFEYYENPENTNILSFIDFETFKCNIYTKLNYENNEFRFYPVGTGFGESYNEVLKKPLKIEKMGNELNVYFNIAHLKGINPVYAPDEEKNIGYAFNLYAVSGFYENTKKLLHSEKFPDFKEEEEGEFWNYLDEVVSPRLEQNLETYTKNGYVYKYTFNNEEDLILTSFERINK